MGFLDRLIGSEHVQGKDPQHLLPELLTSYAEEARLAQQIREHATHSPHQAGTLMLRAAAEEQDQIVRLLREAITDRGGTAGEQVGPLKGGRNHWTRVVHDLEDSQALAKHYNEQVIYWDPDLPDAVELFLALEQRKNRLNALLRDIALRADPHAMD